MDLKFYKEKLEEAGVRFAPGLTDAEIKRAEQAYGFNFPPDLAEFLMYALPVSKRWPNWRKVDDSYIQEIMNRPFEGICFDIERNDFWLEDWGVRPTELTEAFAIAKQKLTEAPKLIPIFAHRYLPDAPNITGNPVFSVSQTDIIYYGADLWNYFENEFHPYFRTPYYQLNEPIRRIEFWSRFAEEEV